MLRILFSLLGKEISMNKDSEVTNPVSILPIHCKKKIMFVPLCLHFELLISVVKSVLRLQFFLQRLNPEVEKMGQSCVDVRKLSTQTE